jgi:hypothetical protein
MILILVGIVMAALLYLAVDVQYLIRREKSTDWAQRGRGR